MYISLETLQRAVRLVADLGDLDDPAEFAQVALPGLAGLLGCDHLAYHEIEHLIAVNLPGRDAPAATGAASSASPARAGFSEQERALLSLMRPPLQAALRRAGSRRREWHAGRNGRDGHDGRDGREGREGQYGRECLEGREGRLTCREAQVMELVANGRTNVAIAHALEVSPRTIAKHLEHIYRKLGVASRAAAVARTAAPVPQAAG